MVSLFKILVLFCIYKDSVSLDRPMAIQAEEFRPKYLSTSPKLSQASVWILHAKRVNWCFCALRTLSLQIVNIEYSNDGDYDTVSVFLDATRLGTFTTYTKSHGTQEWEMFLSSGSLDFDQGFTTIDEGSHNLTIELTEGNSKELELNRIDLIVRSSIPRAKIVFNKVCQAKNCFADPVDKSQALNKSEIEKKKNENMLAISEPEASSLESQSPNQNISVKMAPTSRYGGSFTYRKNGKANVSEECEGCFLAIQRRKQNSCSKEEKVKIELYTKSPRAYRIRMVDESVQVCKKSNLSLFSVRSAGKAACNLSSTLNDEKWLFYSVSKPSAVFPDVINATLNTTYVISYTLENHIRVLYEEYKRVKLTVSLSNINDKVEFVNISATLNWVAPRKSSRIFTQAQPNQEWEFPFKKLITGVNFIVLDFRAGWISRRVCLDSVSLGISTAPPITKTLFRKNQLKICGSTEIGKSIPKMWVHILGTRFQKSVVNALQFSVFSNTSKKFVPLMVLTASRKLYLQTLSRNPDYSTSSYFEIGHRIPTPGDVRFTISSVYVNPLNNVWEIVFSGATSTTTLRLAYTKTITDVTISKQNYRASIPSPAFRLLPIVVFQAKWLEDHSCELYAVNNNTKLYEPPPSTESDQPPVIDWEQVYAKKFTFYGARKPSHTSTYRRPPRLIIESLS